jgi:yeast amino acid transporter
MANSFETRVCITLAVFACMGGDLVIVAAGEAESPRRDLAPCTRFMYLLPISCYILGSFLVGFNINYMDPKLFHPFAEWNYTTSHSPFVIAVSYTSIRVLPAILKACFLFSAYTAA